MSAIVRSSGFAQAGRSLPFTNRSRRGRACRSTGAQRSHDRRCHPAGITARLHGRSQGQAVTSLVGSGEELRLPAEVAAQSAILDALAVPVVAADLDGLIFYW